MMNMQKTILILCLSMFFKTYAQTAALDIKKMNQFYLDQENITLKMTYNFYETENARAPYQSTTGVYKKSKNGVVFNVMGVKNIQNKTYKIAVDDANKVIMVGPITQIDETVFTSNAIDTLIKHCAKTQQKTLANGKVQYTFNYKDLGFVPYIKSVVELNKDYSLSRMVLYYKQVIDYGQEDQESLPFLEINYNSTSMAPIVASVFNIDKYITVSDNKIEGVGKYANYNIINHIIEE